MSLLKIEGALTNLSTGDTLSINGNTMHAPYGPGGGNVSMTTTTQDVNLLPIFIGGDTYWCIQQSDNAEIFLRAPPTGTLNCQYYDTGTYPMQKTTWELFSINVPTAGDGSAGFQLCSINFAGMVLTQSGTSLLLTQPSGMPDSTLFTFT